MYQELISNRVQTKQNSNKALTKVMNTLVTLQPSAAWPIARTIPQTVGRSLQLL